MKKTKKELLKELKKELIKDLRLVRNQINFYKGLLDAHNSKIQWHTHSLLNTLDKKYTNKKIIIEVPHKLGFKQNLLEEVTKNFVILTMDDLEKAEKNILKILKDIRKEELKKQKKKDFEERVDFVIQL